MTNMTYIQRITTRNKINKEFTGFSRFLAFDYMGSAEFEFGALGNSLWVLMENKDNIKYEVVPVTYENKTIDFHVISTESGIVRFKEKITDVINSKTRTKEYTELPEVFSDEAFGITADSWLDITGAVFGDEATISPIFFTIKKRAAFMFVQELLTLKVDEIKDKEFSMFDEVFIRQGRYPGKIIAINEDGTYNVKISNTRYTKIDSYDIWSVKEYPSEQLKKLGFKS